MAVQCSRLTPSDHSIAMREEAVWNRWCILTGNGCIRIYKGTESCSVFDCTIGPHPTDVNDNCPWM